MLNKGIRGFVVILAEQILIEHCFDFLFGDAVLLRQVVFVAELAKDFQSATLVTIAVGFGR